MVNLQANLYIYSYLIPKMEIFFIKVTILFKTTQFVAIAELSRVFKISQNFRVFSFLLGTFSLKYVIKNLLPFNVQYLINSNTYKSYLIYSKICNNPLNEKINVIISAVVKGFCYTKNIAESFHLLLTLFALKCRISKYHYISYNSLNLIHPKGENSMRNFGTDLYAQQF